MKTAAAWALLASLTVHAVCYGQVDDGMKARLHHLETRVSQLERVTLTPIDIHTQGDPTFNGPTPATQYIHIQLNVLRQQLHELEERVYQLEPEEYHPDHD